MAPEVHHSKNCEGRWQTQKSSALILNLKDKTERENWGWPKALKSQRTPAPVTCFLQQDYAT